ncbi:MAG: hypothetical protein EA347_06200 [Thioalkalivibrio sp.]|nr:MAG: hypothetical protein EA347_06200 [Thioalkalivibrio sp.]
MIRMYSRRLMLPFVGVVQIAETEKARALSLDGDYWSIQYRLPTNPQEQTGRRRVDPGSTYTRILGYNHAAVGTVRQGRLEDHPVHPALDLDEVRSARNRLFEAVTAARLPFAAADHYEYWLLDPRDETPLALLYTSVDEQDRALTPPRSEWHPMPAAELKVEPPEPPQSFYVPPVNSRLEGMIAERAGSRPRAAWFERKNPSAGDFPPCLVREDWQDKQQQVLCDLYIRRLAPRLLMIHGLSRPVRHRLEQAAREYVFDVERFHALYPEVVDHRVLTAARVEARMRRANS